MSETTVVSIRSVMFLCLVVAVLAYAAGIALGDVFERARCRGLEQTLAVDLDYTFSHGCKVGVDR